MSFSALSKRFSKAALSLGFVMSTLIFPALVHAQVAAKTEDPKVVYKESLNALSTLYKGEVEKLEKRQQQSKELFNDGLISRVEFESGERTLAEARAKVEQVVKEIELANKPVPVAAQLAAEMAMVDRVWSTGNGRVDNLIRFYGSQHGVDPFLIYCLMSQESSFNSGATSYKGAQGLMQLMPGTAARYGVTNPYDVAQNISGGTRYLRDLLKMFNGRVDLALAGYNAGEGAVMKYGNTIPPYSETKNYVKLILGRYNRKPAS